MAKIKTRSKKIQDFLNYEEYNKIRRSKKKIILEFSFVELYAIYNALLNTKLYTEREFNVVTDKKWQKDLRDLQAAKMEVINFLSKKVFL